MGDAFAALGRICQPKPDFLQKIFRSRQIAHHPIDEAHERVPLRHELGGQRSNSLAHSSPK
jgi:hypothetical protein